MIAIWKPTKNGLKLTQALSSRPVKHNKVTDNNIAADSQVTAKAAKELKERQRKI